MYAIPLVIGIGFTTLGIMGVRSPSAWGEKYERFFDSMPNFYRNSNAWEGTPEELSVRLSVWSIVVGAVFIVGSLAGLLW